MEQEDYQQHIPPEYRKKRPDGTGLTLGEFAEIVTPETLSIFIDRVAVETKPGEYRGPIIQDAAQTLTMDVAELTRLVNEKLTLEEEPEEEGRETPADPELKDRFLRSPLILGKSKTVKNNIIIKEEV